MLLLIAFCIAFAGTALLIPLLKRLRVLDNPNARSNHKMITPRGGGIAIAVASLIGLYLAGFPVPLLMAGGLLGLVSFIDDMKGLSVKWRFLVQFLVVGYSLYSMNHALFPWLPPILEKLLLALAWIWFINLTNFMDGIDGITSMQIIMMSLGICLLGIFYPYLAGNIPSYASILAFATLGFFWFNRSPARIFMGDSGSIFLGYMMGYVLIELAAKGAFFPALILPAYYISDATYTLGKRAIEGKNIAQAHSEHHYQQAVRNGKSHIQVVRLITGLNACLIVLTLLACISPLMGVLACIAGYSLTFFFMRRLRTCQRIFFNDGFLENFVRKTRCDSQE